jgi:hypothetical protein
LVPRGDAQVGELLRNAPPGKRDTPDAFNSAPHGLSWVGFCVKGRQCEHAPRCTVKWREMCTSGAVASTTTGLRNDGGGKTSALHAHKNGRLLSARCAWTYLGERSGRDSLRRMCNLRGIENELVRFCENSNTTILTSIQNIILHNHSLIFTHLQCTI